MGICLVFFIHLELFYANLAQTRWNHWGSSHVKADKVVLEEGPTQVQGYLAHKKQRFPRTTKGPLA